MDNITYIESLFETIPPVEIRLAKRQSEEEPEYAETPGEEGEW